MDLSGIQTLEVPKGYMQMLPTFGPKCKNYGNLVSHVIWFTCLKIYKPKDVNWAYLQKATQFPSHD
jgi:hypothetical protein